MRLRSVPAPVHIKDASQPDPDCCRSCRPPCVRAPTASASSTLNSSGGAKVRQLPGSAFLLGLFRRSHTSLCRFEPTEDGKERLKQSAIIREEHGHAVVAAPRFKEGTAVASRFLPPPPLPPSSSSFSSSSFFLQIYPPDSGECSPRFTLCHLQIIY